MRDEGFPVLKEAQLGIPLLEAPQMVAEQRLLSPWSLFLMFMTTVSHCAPHMQESFRKVLRSGCWVCPLCLSEKCSEKNMKSGASGSS